MPMFDDPNKELQWLQDELLAAEEDDDLFDDLDDLLRDYEEEPETGEDLEDLLMDYEETPQPRKQKEMPRKESRAKKESKPKKESRFGKKAAPQQAELDGEMDEDSVFYKEDYRKAKKKEKSGNRVLLLIIVAELIAIVAILGRWLTWLI